MPIRKVRQIIAAEAVPAVFGAATIELLAEIAGLPPTADLARFGEAIREAARIFARDAGTANVNRVHDEIAALRKVVDPAKAPQWAAIASALEALSPEARKLLAERGLRQSVATALPSPAIFQDPEHREAARAALVRLCQLGGKWIKGRRRPLGKCSRPTWRPLLHAPEPRKQIVKRKAEREFVMWLRIAWLEATGELPSRTARHKDAGRKLGPFARFARECLELVGAHDADVVELINELHRRRRKMEALSMSRINT
jgi:hypothetical protein